jgi:RNA polymerase sigma-70 factor, ECF subfamily
MESGRYTTSGLSPDDSTAPKPADLEEFRAVLRVFAARRIGDWAAAEDVSQEALRVGLEALRAGRISSLEALPGFLFKTAVHICMHRGRSVSREKRALERWRADADEAGADDALSSLLSEERREDLRKALAELEPEERRLLELTYDQELDSEEIGRRLGLTPGAVRVRRHRAIRRLSALLGVTKSRDRELKP